MSLSQTQNNKSTKRDTWLVGGKKVLFHIHIEKKNVGTNSATPEILHLCNSNLS